MDDPPGSRLFVVCGKSAEAEVLQTAFGTYGHVQNVKIIREKGVAYVKFETASTAACAMENLHGVVLNHGRGPKLKVLVADSPNARNNPQARQQLELELACDPDNIPLRSRLFLVVPKTADGNAIKNELNKYSDLDYCKTDLIQSKGIVFAKYAKASSALKGMEEINETGMVAGYKVKCMLAEPKSKRARLEGIMANTGYGIQTQLDFNMGGLHLNKPHAGRHMPGLGLGGVGALASMANMSMGSLSSFSGLGKLDSPLSPQGAISGLGSLGGIRLGAPGNGLGCMGLNTHGAAQMVESHSGLSSGDVSSYTAVDSNLSPTGSLPLLSRQRLFVVVYKGVTEDTLARLFRRFPGMEYCDLKKDKRTGKSKGYCYVNYSSHEAASAAVQHLGGIEFPPHSGHTLKVMFAEILGTKSSPGMPISAMSYSSQTYESGRRFKNSSQDGCEAVLEECEGSVTNGNIHALGDDSRDDCKLFTALTRPMPEYAIHHLFSKFGKIDYVRLQPRDSRMGVIKFTTGEAARDALQMLNGANVLGETLSVSSTSSPMVPTGNRPSQVAGPVA